ncbi:F-box/WD repeat-containing protein 5 [Neocloeon triangulifer]|uniref:F-box/WD repeat-containing protein 5 n=1 Tax=Neocloeon triangulifer TaxID=2078957 RepID=UPI00286F3EB3|nr:F-box/WD repeat-containing protein 5 [Neocloeon triangulifer]
MEDDVLPPEDLWLLLPDQVLLHIYQFLTGPELLRVRQVCQRWHRVGCDEFLWRDLLHTDYKVDKSIGLPPGRTSWMEEYYRLTACVPMLETEVLREHAHQVLHVSFSHNGKMFVTCSKDGWILLWDSGYPAKVKHQHDMKQFSWKYTQYSQFNSTDTLLLVSGVHFGTPHSTSGEIAVFSLQGKFELQCRMANKPYDIFGTWYNDRYLLSGDLYWLAHLVSTSILWLNKASQESRSEHVAIMEQLFRFYNRNASSVRAIMVADCLAPETVEKQKESKQPTKHEEERSGNPPSHHAQTSPMTNMPSAEPGTSKENMDSSKVRCDSTCDFPSPIQYKKEYRLAEAENCQDDAKSEEALSESGEVSVEEGGSILEDSSEDEDEDFQEESLLESRDKFLIFTTGSKTFTPHQIGFKRIKPVQFRHRLDPGPSLQERLAEQRRRAEIERQQLEPGAPPRPPEPNWLDYDSVAERFDRIDHLIDLHGHIIGMGLSPDHRFLYVNSRPWPQDYDITNPLEPPHIAQEIDIHVIDLVTLKEVGTMLRAHKAYTPNNECFFIFLDVCYEYVASGAEDKFGHLWDRHYGTCLVKYPHDDVVNSVAFNPKDPEMLVTVSDDYSIKVWRSRRRVMEFKERDGLTGDENLHGDIPQAVELRKGAKHYQRKRTTSRNLNLFSSLM